MGLNNITFDDRNMKASYISTQSLCIICCSVKETQLEEVITKFMHSKENFTVYFSEFQRLHFFFPIPGEHDQGKAPIIIEAFELLQILKWKLLPTNTSCTVIFCCCLSSLFNSFILPFYPSFDVCSENFRS